MVLGSGPGLVAGGGGLRHDHQRFRRLPVDLRQPRIGVRHSIHRRHGHPAQRMLGHRPGQPLRAAVLRPLRGGRRWLRPLRRGHTAPGGPRSPVGLRGCEQSQCSGGHGSLLHRTRHLHGGGRGDQRVRLCWIGFLHGHRPPHANPGLDRRRRALRARPGEPRPLRCRGRRGQQLEPSGRPGHHLSLERSHRHDPGPRARQPPVDPHRHQ